eukprot:7117482-Prymnesium_polylepis.1
MRHRRTHYKPTRAQAPTDSPLNSFAPLASETSTRKPRSGCPAPLPTPSRTRTPNASERRQRSNAAMHAALSRQSRHDQSAHGAESPGPGMHCLVAAPIAGAAVATSASPPRLGKM